MLRATTCLLTFIFALAVLSTSAHLEPRPLGTHALAARRASASFQSKWYQSNYKNGASPPGASAKDAAGQKVIISNAGGGDNKSQRKSCPTVFIGGAAVDGSPAGWKKLPKITGFKLSRSFLKIDGASQPVYLESTKDHSKVKRVVISQPGMPRDSWAYLRYLSNALLCAASRDDLNIDLDEVLVVGPAWLGEGDKKAGATKANDIYFSNSGWSAGRKAKGPGKTDVTSFEVMDALIAKFFDKSAFPNVKNVVVAGHSLGATFTQRYAVMRKPTANDAHIGFFVGNPGSYLFPVKSRPVNPSKKCDKTKDAFPYGLGKLPAYAGKSKRSDITKAYYSRHVMYALGLADHEGGDSHCESQYQGDSHLARGQNLEKALEKRKGGKPAKHVFNYVKGVKHQDYLMFSASRSLKFLFAQDFN